MARRRLTVWGAWLLPAVALVVLGCVERRMTIRSNPPGALVHIDRKELGVTPVSTAFVHYGTRRIKLVKEGYETLDVKERVYAPVYDYWMWELIVEMLPIRFRDERELSYDLKKAVPPDPDDLVERAWRLRTEAQAQREYPPGVEGPWQDSGIINPDDPSWLEPGVEPADQPHPVTEGLEPAE